MEKREVWGEIRNMIKYVCGKKKMFVALRSAEHDKFWV
jgi:hypothetical protein